MTEQQQLAGAQPGQKKKATGTSPEREYVVVAPSTADGGGFEVVGRFKGHTPKQARIAAAKSGELPRELLVKGVKLRAIAASAFDADKDAPPVKLEVREEFSA